jgi:GNAT superfamily N-acetyltransferase
MTAATSDYTIRTDLRPGDVGDVIALHGRLYSALCGWNPVFEAYVGATFAEALPGFDPARERIWLVESGGAIRGCIAIVSRGPDKAQLRWFLLDPSLKGRGLGRKMLEEALRFTRDAGYRRVVLSTTDGLPESAHLYTSVGFRKVEDKPAHTLWGGPAPVVEQVWELDFA